MTVEYLGKKLLGEIDVVGLDEVSSMGLERNTGTDFYGCGVDFE